MKKGLAFLLTLGMTVTLFAGCGTTESASNSENKSEEIENAINSESGVKETESVSETEENVNIIPEDQPIELTLDFSFGTRTGDYYGELNDEGIPDGEGTFSSVNSASVAWTYTGEWDNGHWNSSGTWKWDDGQIYEGEFLNDSMHGYGEDTFANGNVYKGNFSEGDAKGEGTFYFPDGAYFVGEFSGLNTATGQYYDANGICYDAYIEEGNVHWEPAEDFFKDEERQEQYETLYKSYQMSALYDYVNDYITEAGEDISPTDSAYSILELVEPLVEYESTWTVTQDEFNGSYDVTFDGANEISSSESVDVNVNGTNIRITVGFQKSDWLFFDKFAMSVDSEVVETKSIASYDRNDDVIGAGIIEESYSGSQLFKNASEQIKDGEIVILRFTNSDTGEQYDHTLTQAEKNAIYVGYLLRDNYTELSNLIFRYRRNYEAE